VGYYDEAVEICPVNSGCFEFPNIGMFFFPGHLAIVFSPDNDMKLATTALGS